MLPRTAPFDGTVAKLSTKSSGSLDRHVLFGSRTVGYSVSVSADAGVVPGGTVAIYDGTRLVQTVQLGPDGTAQVQLSGLSRGYHLFTARYAGTTQLASSFGLPDLLIVF